MRRAADVAVGTAIGLSIVWITFAASPGTVQVATLVLVVTSLIWFATVDSARLVDEHGRPHVMLFLLAGLALAILTTAALVLSGGTVFLILAAGLLTIVVGLVRAIRHGMSL